MKGLRERRRMVETTLKVGMQVESRVCLRWVDSDCCNVVLHAKRLRLF